MLRKEHGFHYTVLVYVQTVSYHVMNACDHTVPPVVFITKLFDICSYDVHSQWKFHYL